MNDRKAGIAPAIAVSTIPRTKSSSDSKGMGKIRAGTKPTTPSTSTTNIQVAALRRQIGGQSLSDSFRCSPVDIADVLTIPPGEYPASQTPFPKNIGRRKSSLPRRDQGGSRDTPTGTAGISPICEQRSAQGRFRRHPPARRCPVPQFLQHTLVRAPKPPLEG